MGLKDSFDDAAGFVGNVGKAVGNVAKVAGYVADPRNIDNIVEGAGTAAKFAIENPEVVGQIGKEIVKDQLLDPKNLAINVGLTLATGGVGTAAAVAARTAWGARAAKGAITAVKAGETAVEAGRAAKYASKAVEIGRAAENALEGGGRLAKGIDKINDIRKTASPFTTRMHEFRTGLGEKALKLVGEGPAGQALANVVQGTGGIGKTTRMVGQTENAYRAQQQARYVKMGYKGYRAASQAAETVGAVADPYGYVARRAMENLGKTKMGDTGEYETLPGGQAVVPDAPEVVPSNDDGLDISENGVPARQGFFNEGRMLRGAQKVQNIGAGIAASNTFGGSNAFWKGPEGSGREAFGGVGTDYDWRTYNQRPVNQLPRSSSFVDGQMAAISHPGRDTGGTANRMAKEPLAPLTQPPMAAALPPPKQVDWDLVQPPKVNFTTPTDEAENQNVGTRMVSTGGNDENVSAGYKKGVVIGEPGGQTTTGLGFGGNMTGSLIAPPTIDVDDPTKINVKVAKVKSALGQKQPAGV